MANIYDLFNNRKKEIEALEEATQIEEAGCKKKKACEGAVEEAGCGKKKSACEACAKRKTCEMSTCGSKSKEEAPVEEAGCKKKKACEGVEYDIAEEIDLIDESMEYDDNYYILESDDVLLEAVDAEKADADINKMKKGFLAFLKKEKPEKIEEIKAAKTEEEQKKVSKGLVKDFTQWLGESKKRKAAFIALTAAFGLYGAGSVLLYMLYKKKKAAKTEATKESAEVEDMDDEELTIEESTEIEEFENLDIAIEALENIVMENNSDLIEFQAAAYLEDLVLENMMYDDFDEDRISGIVEAVNNERLKKIGDQVQAQWNKLKEWFTSVMRAVENFFSSGEQLLKKYKTIIPDAIKNCKAKVKMNNWNDPDTAHQKCLAKIMALTKVAFSDRSYEENKKSMLADLGVKDRAGIATMVKKEYANGEATEQLVSGIDLARATKYINDKKQMIRALKEVYVKLNKLFTDLINRCRQGDAIASMMPEQQMNDVKSLNFAVGIVTAIINAEISCVKKAANDYAAVIRKAVSAYKPVKTNGQEKEEPKSLGESYISRLESVTELEFIDEIDEIDFED